MFLVDGAPTIFPSSNAAKRGSPVPLHFFECRSCVTNELFRFCDAHISNTNGPLTYNSTSPRAFFTHLLNINGLVGIKTTVSRSNSFLWASQLRYKRAIPFLRHTYCDTNGTLMYYSTSPRAFFTHLVNIKRLSASSKRCLRLFERRSCVTNKLFRFCDVHSATQMAQ